MEITKILAFYVYIFLFGLIGLPIANHFFKGFKDKGYGFAKVIGLIVAGFPLWFLSSLRIIQFNDISIFVFFLIPLVISFYFIRRMKIKVNKFMVVQELLFLINFVVWTLIRSTNSKIEGTEKFMNLAFMNSISRTDYFPPADPWFSGESINYYYMGHFFFTFITRLAGIAISIGYNLSLNFVIAQFFSGCVSIFLTLFKFKRHLITILFSVISATFISYGGNAHYFFKLFGSKLSGSELDYFFPDATRIIGFTINEFPAYSIVLGDLHGHFNSLIFFILLIGLAFVWFKQEFKLDRSLVILPIISFLLFLTYTVNSWDIITLNLVFLFINIYKILSIREKDLSDFKFLSRIKSKVTRKAIVRIIYLVIAQLLLLSGVVLLFPFILNFNPPVGGIGIVPFNIKSEITPWVLMWYVFLFITILTLLLKVIKGLNFKSEKWKFIFILNFVAIGLILGVELIFVKDLFFQANFDYFRTNTVFKFYYHAWILWGISICFYAYQIFSKLKSRKWVINLSQSLVMMLFLISITYVFKAVTDFYDLENYKYGTIDGNTYISTNNSEDKLAIDWINENIDKQGVIVEVVGEAYTYYSRISTNTGLKTIMGWPTHEWQWRNDLESIDKRKADIETLYLTLNINKINSIIEKYSIDYIYWGQLEIERHDEASRDIFDNNFEMIFQTGNTKIYKVN